LLISSHERTFDGQIYLLLDQQYKRAWLRSRGPEDTPMPTELPAASALSLPLDHVAAHRLARRARDRAIAEAFGASFRALGAWLRGTRERPVPRLG
jgi:hypothetical protein